MSQTLVDLGLGGAVVGRTPYCDAIDPAVPVVGSLIEVDFERLHHAAPTHLVVQPSASGLDPALERVAREAGWKVHAQRLDRLDDVERFLAAMPAFLAEEGAERDRLAARAGQLAAALAGLHAQRPAADAPRVLLAVSVDPIAAAGRDTFLSELLEGSGRRNAIEERGYPELTLEDLVALRPDAIVLLREREPGEMEGARLVAALRVGASTAPITVLCHPASMLPSSAATGVARALEDALHSIEVPTRFADTPKEPAR